MTSELLNIGFGNYVHKDKVLAIMAPSSAPMKRLRELAREEGRLVDLTEGRKTRCLLLMETNHLILSGVMSETVAQRFSGMTDKAESDEP